MLFHGNGDIAAKGAGIRLIPESSSTLYQLNAEKIRKWDSGRRMNVVWKENGKIKFARIWTDWRPLQYTPESSVSSGWSFHGDCCLGSRSPDHVQDIHLEQTSYDHIPESVSFGRFMGQSARIKELFKILPAVAQTDSSILITGKNRWNISGS